MTYFTLSWPKISTLIFMTSFYFLDWKPFISRSPTVQSEILGLYRFPDRAALRMLEYVLSEWDSGGVERSTVAETPTIWRLLRCDWSSQTPDGNTILRLEAPKLGNIRVASRGTPDGEGEEEREGFEMHFSQIWAILPAGNAFTGKLCENQHPSKSITAVIRVQSRG